MNIRNVGLEVETYQRLHCALDLAHMEMLCVVPSQRMHQEGQLASVPTHAETETELGCEWLGGDNNKKFIDIEVGAGACDGIYSICAHIGSQGSSLTKIQIPDGECNEPSSLATSINGIQYNVGKCDWCGYDSTFDGTFIANNDCCAVDGSFGFNIWWANDKDEACNYIPEQEQEEPNPCKSQVLSFTEAECKCKNTFIQSDNKLDCICPSNYEFAMPMQTAASQSLKHLPSLQLFPLPRLPLHLLLNLLFGSSFYLYF